MNEIWHDVHASDIGWGYVNQIDKREVWLSDVWNFLGESVCNLRNWQLLGYITKLMKTFQQFLAEADVMRSGPFPQQQNWQGDSNPMNNPWVDTWHKAQDYASQNNLKAAIPLMRQAANQASQQSPGEAKYYLATIAWLSGNTQQVQRYIRDKDVVSTGNNKVLRRLLFSKSRNYQQAYGRM
jgi:hypothetical protein